MNYRIASAANPMTILLRVFLHWIEWIQVQLFFHSGLVGGGESIELNRGIALGLAYASKDTIIWRYYLHHLLLRKVIYSWE